MYSTTAAIWDSVRLDANASASTPSALYDGRLVRGAHAISDTGESWPEVPFAVGAMTARGLCTKDAGTICLGVPFL